MTSTGTKRADHEDRRLFYVTCLIGFALGIENSGLQFVILNIADEFGMSDALMGSLVTIQFIALTTAALIAGFTANKFGKKNISIVAAALFAASSLLCFIRPGMVPVMIGILGCGMAFGSIEISVSAAMADQYAAKGGKYLLIMQGILGIGSVIGPLITDWIMRMTGADWNILFLMCVILFGLIMILLFFTPFKAGDIAEEQRSGSVSRIFRDTAIIGLLACGACYGAMETGMGSFVDTYFAKVALSPGCSAITLSLYWGAIGVVRLIAGAMYRYRRAILLIAYAGGGLLYLAMYVVRGAVPAIVVITALGLVIGATLPTLVSLANDRFPENTGVTTSIVNAASGVGSSLSPPVIGMLLGSMSLSGALAGIGLLGFIAAGVFVTISRRIF